MPINKETEKRIELLAKDLNILARGIQTLKEKEVSQDDIGVLDQNLAVMFMALQKMNAYLHQTLPQEDVKDMDQFMDKSEKYMKDALDWIRSHPLYWS